MHDARTWVVVAVQVATVFGCLAVFLIQLRGLSMDVCRLGGLRDDLRGLHQDLKLLEAALERLASRR